MALYYYYIANSLLLKIDNFSDKGFLFVAKFSLNIFVFR